MEETKVKMVKLTILCKTKLFARSKLHNQRLLIEKNQKQVTTIIEFKP